MEPGEEIANQSPSGKCALKIENAVAAMGEKEGGRVDVVVRERKETVEELEVKVHAADQV